MKNICACFVDAQVNKKYKTGYFLYGVSIPKLFCPFAESKVPSVVFAIDHLHGIWKMGL